MQMPKKLFNNSYPSESNNTALDLYTENLLNTEYINALGKKLANHYEKEFVLTFPNATQSIFFLCLALGIKNKAIITTPFTWGGSIAPFLFFNNKIVFLEFSFDSYCLDSQKLIKNIPQTTKALLSVDYCGNPADTESLKEYCEEHGLLFISDSSQSFGAYYNGKPAGYYADVIITSFGQGKTLYGGEGGALITSDEKLYESLIWLSQHPQRQKKYYGLSYLNQFGLNGRINPLAAKQIVLNWNYYIDRIIRKQRSYFNIYNHLKSSGMIKPKNFLKLSENSTFYFPLFELNGSQNSTPPVINNKVLSKKLILYTIQLLDDDLYFKDEYSHLSANLISKKFRTDVKHRNFILIR